jgi:hypothetical protein
MYNANAGKNEFKTKKATNSKDIQVLKIPLSSQIHLKPIIGHTIFYLLLFMRYEIYFFINLHEFLKMSMQFFCQFFPCQENSTLDST